MKKLLICALVGAAGLATPLVALADHVPVGETYDTRGQCEAAIKQSRNDARRDGSQNSGAYNKDFTSENFFCMKNSEGSFMIVNGDDM